MININFNELFERYKIPTALGLVGIVLIAGGLFLSNSKNKSERIEQFPKESLVASHKQIAVDVSGAVRNPGVYQLAEGSRVEQAVEAAGGFDEKANSEYVSKYLNMAQSLSDGSKIYIPFVGEQVPTGAIGIGSAAKGVVSGANTQAKVNINIGTQVELEALPGIGPVTASKIISGRPYSKVDDLLNQKIVNKSTFEKIEDLLSIY